MARRKRAQPDFEYDVCLSFAGEDRVYVRKVANALRSMGVRVFFDEYAQVELWGRDLYAHLDDVYQNAARYCVLFASRHYARRVWPDHERQSAQARAIREHREYVLPVRFDGTDIPGLRPTVGFLDAARLAPKKLAELVRAKLGAREAGRFFPPEPDLLFRYAKARSSEARDSIHGHALNLFEALKRMTADERAVVLRVFLNACDEDLPRNVHISLDLLRRLTGFPRNKIVRLASGLRSLGIYAQIRERAHDRYLGELPTLDLEWHDLSSDSANATSQARTILMAASQGHCDECGFELVHGLDFSQLASSTKRRHRHAG